MAMKNPKAAKADVESAGFSCYIGPNIPGVIQKGTIYPVGKAEAVKLPEVELAVSQRPGVAALIVDGSTLPEDRVKVKKPGEPLYAAYRSLLRR